MSKVIAVCISEKKGTVKTEVPLIHCIEDYGIENDAHAGKWHRQVSLMSLKDMEDFHQDYPTEDYGAYAENILIDHVCLRFLPIGTRIYIHDVILEVTQIGKECHQGCAIQQRTGTCIMPRIGIFTKVIRGGTISKDNEVFIEVPTLLKRQAELISPMHQQLIHKQKVVIVGLGALGQMVSAALVRMGYHHLVLVDGDVISYDNFNRQIYANHETIGRSKVEVTKQELLKINPLLKIETYSQFLNQEMQLSLENSILVDCVDQKESKLFLEKLASLNQIVLVHGAIDGWYGQVATLFPGDNLLEMIYAHHQDHPYSSLMISAQVVSALRVKDIYKVTIGEYDDLRHRMIMVDMYENEIKTLNLSRGE